MGQILIEESDYFELKAKAEANEERFQKLEHALESLKALLIDRTTPPSMRYYEDKVYYIVSSYGGRAIPLKTVWHELRDRKNASLDLTGNDVATRKKRSRIRASLDANTGTFMIFKRGSQEMIKIV